MSIAKPRAQTDKERQEADVLVRRFLHALASRRLDVREVRNDVLGGGLLRRRDVPAWLRDQSTRPRRGTIVAYEWHEGADLPGVPVRRGGVLERVHRFVDDLKDDFVGWSHGDALYFFLTGAVVGAPSLVRDGVDRTGHLVFSVNPLLSPRELAEDYARIRRSVFGSRIQRLRRQKLKALRLALFVAQRLDSGASWKDRMHEWNRLQPQDAYDPDDGLSNFWRDAHESFERLKEQLEAYKQDGGSE